MLAFVFSYKRIVHPMLYTVFEGSEDEKREVKGALILVSFNHIFHP